jgi:hypothetical protein
LAAKVIGVAGGRLGSFGHVRDAPTRSERRKEGILSWPRTHAK